MSPMPFWVFATFVLMGVALGCILAAAILA